MDNNMENKGNDYGIDDMPTTMDEMKEELLSLRETLKQKEAELAEKLPDMHTVKGMLEEGYEKFSKAVKPVVEEAHKKIGEPAKEVVHKVEEKIQVHPITAVVIALGAGLILGKCIELTSNNKHH